MCIFRTNDYYYAYVNAHLTDNSNTACVWALWVPSSCCECAGADIVECEGNELGPCGTPETAVSCANTNGSFTCVCQPGYFVNTEGICEGISQLRATFYSTASTCVNSRTQGEQGGWLPLAPEFKFMSVLSSLHWFRGTGKPVRQGMEGKESGDEG